jgi:hypothetical protein
LDKRLSSARLTLTLRNGPFAPGPPTDLVRIVELPGIQLIPLFIPEAHAVGTIQFELLDVYTSEEILSALDDGLVDMAYADDAIVAYAALNLVSSRCPSCRKPCAPGQ